MTDFERRYGFERSACHLGNWRERPYSQWSFQHVGEVVPSSVIACGEPTVLSDAADFEDISVEVRDRNTDLSTFLQQTETDALLVSRGGEMVSEWTAPHADRAKPHIIFSISKSLTALLYAIVEEQGVIDLDKTAAHYWPQAARSGYGDCPLRHVLDMRVSLAFEEEYLDADGDYARYRRSTLWNPPRADKPNDDLGDLLCSLEKGEGEHGGAFQYLSPNSDMLGTVLEKATGIRFADLLSQLVWQKMGARSDALITVDARGRPRAAGGVSVVAHDLLAVGEMICNDGAVGSRQIVPAAWIEDMRDAGDRDAWSAGNFAGFSTIDRYRSQWYQLAAPSRVVMGIGIHGQFLYVDPATETVIVRMASQTLPIDQPQDEDWISVFNQIAAL